MLLLLRHRLTRRVLYTLVFELVALIGVIGVLLYGRSFLWDMPALNAKIVIFALSSTAIIQFGFWSFGLYSIQVIYSGRRVARSLFHASALLSVVLFFFCYLYSLAWNDLLFHPTGRSFPVFLAVVFPALVYIERFAVLKFFNEGCPLGNLVIVGTGNCTEQVIREARAHHGDNLNIVGVLGGTSGKRSEPIEGCPVIGPVSDLQRVVDQHEVRTIVLALPYDHPDLPLDYLLECKMAGMIVCDAGAFYESVSQKVLLERLEPFSVLFPDSYTMTRLRWLTKGLFERILAITLLTLFAVPMALIYFAVRFSSNGGAIFRQSRVGKAGETFTLYKFRTMIVDAESDLGAQWAVEGDPRVTPLGRWLRRTRLDELPQLLNVLRGDMAFVGPRPERPEFVDRLKTEIPFYHHRHFVKSGLTGWAQVQFAYARSLDDSREKLRYDLYYVKHMSLFFDFVIILATLRAVLKGSGVK